MAAPNRLRVMVGDLVVSAFILPSLDEGSEEKPVCKSCAPRRTKMSRVCQLSIPHKGHADVFDVYRCSFCAAQWAVPWTVLDQEGGPA